MAKSATKSRIVAAAGAAVGRQNMGEAQAKDIEAAMVKAIEDANAAGISDPDKIRAAMMKARDEALKAA